MKTAADHIPNILDGLFLNLGVTAWRVTPEAKLRSDLGLDSLDIMDLCTKMESYTGEEISDETAAKWKTVKDLSDFLTAHLR
ncbi:MAG: acyl carrier protein [Fibrobacteria bacterium]